MGCSVQNDEIPGGMHYPSNTMCHHFDTVDSRSPLPLDAVLNILYDFVIKHVFLT